MRAGAAGDALADQALGVLHGDPPVAALDEDDGGDHRHHHRHDERQTEEADLVRS